jgi:mono/diheme cytochrome c family protein
MTRTTLLFSTAIALAAIAGCYTGPSSDLSPAMHGPGTDVDGTLPAGENGEATPDGGSAAAEGLPCDVAKVLASSCTDCHGARLKGGAPNALLSYDDLVAPSMTDPQKTVAEISLARMRSTKDPMPPDGALSPSDIAVLDAWVAAKMPKGSCGSTPAAPDASTTADSGGGADADAGDAGKDPAPSPTVCTSGTTWAPGTPASPLMHPGKTCIACHSATGGPSFTLAGTVFPTLHEPNDCNGAAGGGSMTVVIIDAAGKTHSMPVNAAGNFTRVTGIPMPYRAMVVKGTKTREMKTAQTDGDCNGCHTEQGNHSPGRIMAP